MSAVNPEQKAVVAELMRRRATLDPDKQAVVDELGKRFGLSAEGDPNAAIKAQQAAKYPTAAEQGGNAKLGDTPLGALTLGVDPATFLDRVGGAAATLINPLLPSGDTRKTAPQLPELTPNQEIGAKAAVAGPLLTGVLNKVPGMAASVASKIPSTARAGAKFDTIMGAAKDVPIDTSVAEQSVARAQELRQRGSTLPKVFNDFTKDRTAATDMLAGTQEPMTYGAGRDFASNAGALSIREATAMNAKMQRQVAEFAAAMKSANREAAAKVGMGELYDSAMKEYRQAASLKDAGEIVKKWASRVAFMTALGGAGKLGYELWKSH